MKIIFIYSLLIICTLLFTIQGVHADSSEEDIYIYLNNVDDPSTVQEIQLELTAFDEIDGDVTENIYVVMDNYSDNNNVLGDFIIVYGVTDSYGSKTTIAITVRNIDITAPQFVIEALSTLHIPQYSYLPSNLPGVKAIDLFEGDISSDIIITGLDLIDTDTIGDYILEYRVSDSSGNETIESFVVNVVDSIAPTIVGPLEIIKRSNYILDGQFYLSYFSAEDDHDGIISNRIEIISDEYLGNANKAGTYEVVISVSDILGNFTNHTLKIVVKDEMIPHLIIDKYYWVVPNNHLLTDNDFIDTLQSINDLPNYTFIFTTSYDNYTNFFERIDKYQKNFDLISSTGNEYERNIILDVVDSDFNIIEQEPGFFQNYGKLMLGIGAGACLITLFFIGVFKK